MASFEIDLFEARCFQYIPVQHGPFYALCSQYSTSFYGVRKVPAVDPPFQPRRRIARAGCPGIFQLIELVPLQYMCSNEEYVGLYRYILV